MQLEGKRVFITGATGLVGGGLARRLARIEGVQIRCLVRSPEKAQDLAALGAEVVPGDLTDPSSVARALGEAQVVFHAAGWVGASRAAAEAWSVNVDGTRHVVEAALAAGVQRFVHVSSCSVYGSLQMLGIDEGVPARPRGDPYADSKVAAEEVVFAAYREHGLPAVVARSSQIYGPGSTQYTVRPVKALKSGMLFLVDGGRHYCKPVYIDNLVDGLLLCATVEAAVGEAINLTDDDAIPWSVFFNAYARMAGVKPLRSVPYPAAWLAALAFEAVQKLRGRKANVSRDAINSLRSINSFSNRKAKKLLGWTPAVDLAEGMRRSEVWLRQQGYLE